LLKAAASPTLIKGESVWHMSGAPQQTHWLAFCRITQVPQQQDSAKSKTQFESAPVFCATTVRCENAAHGRQQHA
jgi:hypothetical protein